jgi:hypothetical protein
MQWAAEGSPPWVVIGLVGLIFLNVLTMAPAIRKAERRGPITDPAERQRLRRRGYRLMIIVVGPVFVTSLIVISVAESVGVALAVAAISTPGFVLGIWLSRRWTRTSS